MKKVIVTGGCGFIGSNLINHLLKNKFFVINIDKLSYSSNLQNIRNFKKRKDYLFFKSDIANQKKIFNILTRYKPSIIFNLAAETHVDRSIDSPKSFIENNINAVFNLLETIKKYNNLNKKKIKLIHVSTDEVYGDIVNKKIKANEEYKYNPSSPYAASKASSDHLIKSYIRTYDFPAIITNCSNNYGPNQFPEKLIPKIIYNILNNKPIPIYGNGSNSREWIYVEDHCRALRLISSRGKIGQNYNIGSDVEMNNLTIAKLILKIIKKKINKLGKNVKIKFVEDRPGHDIRYALNSKKIKNKIKWNPKISLNQGISQTIDWYINNPNYFKSLSKKEHVFRMGLKK